MLTLYIFIACFLLICNFIMVIVYWIDNEEGPFTVHEAITVSILWPGAVLLSIYKGTCSLLSK